MKELLEKISSYNIFNYLFPGVLFAVIGSEISNYSFIQQNIVIGSFVYYFIGLVISRIGSLIIEPILKKTNFVKFADYKDYVLASQKDSKIEVLSEANNMFRTLISVFLSLALLFLYSIIELKFPILKKWNIILSIIALLILFLFSYRKQINYITYRIKSNK